MELLVYVPAIGFRVLQRQPSLFVDDHRDEIVVVLAWVSWIRPLVQKIKKLSMPICVAMMIFGSAVEDIQPS